MSTRSDNRRPLLLAVFCLSLLSGCSLFQPKPEIVDTDPAKMPLPPELIEAYNEGLALLKDGEYDAAELHWTGLTEQYAQYPGNWLNLAVAQYRLEKFSESLSSVGKAQEINPEFCPAYSVRGLDERELGQFKEAEKSYLSAIQCNPADVNARYNLGILYDLYLHDLPKALEQYAQVQTMNAAPDETIAMWITDLERRNAEQVAGDGS
ncbi:tetratricopeptide repeat protein [Thalassolituus sp. LLYu03]|uniref:tetratricopeptide repeat protein n=1 Tax=Thalassolituus sp. LLYu03 TaxID=3421656 RepID=UPI003D28813E